MSPNYKGSTTKDLRTYVLAHPNDDEAFYAFVDRKHQEIVNPIVIEPDAPDWDIKSQTIIQELIGKYNATLTFYAYISSQLCGDIP
jgi:hypothetical protein